MKEVNDSVKLFSIKMKGMLIVSSRDLSIIWHSFPLSDGSHFIMQCSVVDDRIPETDSVRAEAIINGLLLEKASSSSTRITSITNIDPKGSIPSTLINSMTGRQHDIFVAIKRKLES